MALHPGRDAEAVRAQIAFHAAIGVDVVLVPEAVPAPEVEAVFREHIDSDLVHVVGRPDVWRDLPARMRLAAEIGADWLVDAREGEFWFPRAPSLPDLLAPVPPRYGRVQALRRLFVRQAPGDHSSPFWEAMTLRRGVDRASSTGSPGERLGSLHRVTGPGADLTGAGQPLRAWYPIEILTWPGEGAPLDTADIRRRAESGELVVDERLRDALRALGVGRAAGPVSGPPALELPVPDVVEDAQYAIECAAVGEVDLSGLEVHIRELEARITELEARFWPRVLRRLTRGRRRSRP